MKYNSFIAFDLETTGLNNFENEIIEIGIVKFENGKLVDVYSEMVRPNGRISSYVERMTGITNEAVSTAPTFSELADDIVGFIGDAFLVGHNIGFDLEMLNSSLQKCDLMPLYNLNIDTLDLVPILLPRNRSYKLSHLAKHYGISEENVHRAKDDALMTANLYLKLTEEISNFDHNIAQFLYYYASYVDWALAEVLKSIFGKRIKKEEIPWILLFIEDEKTKPHPKKGKKQKNTAEFADISIHSLFSIFQPDGNLSKRQANYELRSSQLDMVEKVWGSFENNQHCVVEAGTGTGKSFAYLVPAIFFALKNNQRVMVSTKTKNLQEQLVDKDIPFLKKALGIDFSFVMVKGRENYVCINKLAYLFAKIIQDKNTNDFKVVLAVMNWVLNSETGDFTEIHNNLANRFKNQLFSDSYSCLQHKCPFKSICFLNRIKSKAKKVELIVVNHALLLSDVYYGSSVLPHCDYLIMDEAHTIEDVATGCFSHGVVKKRIHEISVKLSEQKIWEGIEDITDDEKQILKTLTVKGRQLIDQNKALFEFVNQIFKEKEKDNIFFKKYAKKLGMSHLNEIEKGLLEEKLTIVSKNITGIDSLLADINDLIKDKTNKIQYAFYKKLLLEVEFVRSDLSFLRHEKANNVRWLEKVELKRSKFCQINAVPVIIGEALQKYIFDDKLGVVFTSATLSVKSSFNYFLARIGYLDSQHSISTHTLNSPFDLESNILLGVPMDSPTYEDSGKYLADIAAYIKKLVLFTKGKALILFTSHKHLNEVFYLIKDELSSAGIQLYCQGKKMSDRNLIKAFKEDTNSVLMGMDSFWQGIDVPGKSLSHVIIVKLPFEVPTDPVVMARMEAVASNGRSSFFEYVIPNAVVRFKQGFGRLIRSKNDRGTVIILDKRVLTQGYGKKFLQSVIATKIYPKDIGELKKNIQEWF